MNTVLSGTKALRGSAIGGLLCVSFTDFSNILSELGWILRPSQSLVFEPGLTGFPHGSAGNCSTRAGLGNVAPTGLVGLDFAATEDTHSAQAKVTAPLN